MRSSLLESIDPLDQIDSVVVQLPPTYIQPTTLLRSNTVTMKHLIIIHFNDCFRYSQLFSVWIA